MESMTLSYGCFHIFHTQSEGYTTFQEAVIYKVWSEWFKLKGNLLNEPAQQIVYRHPAESYANRLTYLMQRGMTTPGMDSNLFSGHFFFWRVLDVLRDLFRTTVSGSKQPQKWLRPALFLPVLTLSGFQLYYLHQEGYVFDRVCIVCKYNSYKSFQWLLIKL